MGRRANFHIDKNWEEKQFFELYKRGAWPDAAIRENERHHDLIIKIENKFVRWKGRKYTAFTLEDISNMERNKPGWMKTSDAAYLDYFMERPEGWVQYRMKFPALQKWFYENDRHLTYYQHKEKNDVGNGNFYTTSTRVVPIGDIPTNFFVIKDKFIKK